MPDSLPDSLDFFKQVERNMRYSGAMPVKALPRLVASLENVYGVFRACISFGTRACVPCLDGKVEADVECQYQRCLEPVTISISGEFRFGLVQDEADIDKLPAEFEPFLVGEGEQSLLEVIEDELILSLPLVTRHDYDCSDVLKQQGGTGKQDTYRPFADLKDLMSQD